MKNKLILLIVAASAVQFLVAQTPLTLLDADELFLRARNLAFNNQHDSARVLLKIGLRKNPLYADIRILLARTYAWDGRRSEAREELKTVLHQKPKYLDAYLAAIDVEVWDEKLDDALILCNTALKFNPNSEELLVKRIKIYRDMKKDTEALFSLTMLEELNRTNPEIEPLRESIKTQSLLNSVGVLYTYDWFTTSRYNPRNQFTVQYSRVTPYGSALLKLNRYQRFGNTGYQVEVEAYPKIMNGIYAYANYGYSWTKNFPKHRFGLEPYFKLPESFEASIGTRLLFFSSTPSDIYTASLGYYYGDYWFSLRAYVTPGTVSSSRSIVCTVRQYFGGDGTYVFIKGGAGSSPDEDQTTDISGTKLNLLKSQSAGLGTIWVIDMTSAVEFTFDYRYTEIVPSFLVNNYSIYVGYKYMF